MSIDDVTRSSFAAASDEAAETEKGIANALAHGIAPDVYRRRWWILSVLCLSLLIVFIGNSSLNGAIPTLARELGATESQLQWVVASYSLVFAGLLLTSGAVGDRYGRKGILQLGLVIFMFGCLAAATSDSIEVLIACRAVMGVGAALIMPSTLSILVNVFPPHERTKAIAAWAAVTGAAGAIGPVASGLLLNHFWYGSIFLINVPICAFALITGAFLVPKSRDPEEARLDPIGAVLSIVGIVAIVYGLIEAPAKGWSAPVTIAAFGIGLVVLLAFALWELHTDEPMLDVRFFENRAFSTGTAGMVLIFMSMFGVMFLMTQYLQLILGYSPLGAAVRLLPMAPIMVIVAPLTPRLSARIGANKTVGFGMLLTATGLMLLRGVQVDTAYLYILMCLACCTSGFALAMSPMTAAIMSAVPQRRAGAGSAMNDASRELGAALGVAVMGSLAASQYRGAVGDLTSRLPASAQDAAQSSISGALRVAGSLPGPVGDALRAGADAAFIDGIHLAVTVGSMLALLAAFLTVRYLPAKFAHDGAMHDGVSAMEEVAELGLGGVPPIFADGD